MTQEATARRRQLGRALRKAREGAGLTQSAVAEELGCKQGKVNKIETTLVAVGPDDLKKMVDLYKIPPEQADQLRELAAEDHRDGPRRTGFKPAWSAFGELSDLERTASEILCWHSERIPGPLQSEHYMLQMFQTDKKLDLDITALIKQRKARARIFSQASPPDYRVILSESSMLRMPGGRFELIIDQAEHLLDLVHRYKQLDLQILLFAANVPFVDTDFEILRFKTDERDFAYIEGAGGARTFKSKRDIQRFAEHWDLLRDAALSPGDSQEFLNQLVETSRDKWHDKRNE